MDKEDIVLSRASSQRMDPTQVSGMAGGFFVHIYVYTHTHTHLHTHTYAYVFVII